MFYYCHPYSPPLSPPDLPPPSPCAVAGPRMETRSSSAALPWIKLSLLPATAATATAAALSGDAIGSSPKVPFLRSNWSKFDREPYLLCFHFFLRFWPCFPKTNLVNDGFWENSVHGSTMSLAFSDVVEKLSPYNCVRTDWPNLGFSSAG